jgi:HEPN domain-containing protein
MPYDPQHVVDMQAWLRRSEQDIRAAETDLTAHPPLLSDTAFHCQQSIEKALKAFLVWHDVPFRRTHDLAEIGQQCISIDASLEPLCRRAEPLTVYAWTFRYPGDDVEPTREEVDVALSIAREAIEVIRALCRTDLEV